MRTLLQVGWWVKCYVAPHPVRHLVTRHWNRRVAVGLFWVWGLTISAFPIFEQHHSHKWAFHSSFQIEIGHLQNLLTAEVSLLLRSGTCVTASSADPKLPKSQLKQVWISAGIHNLQFWPVFFCWRTHPTSAVCQRKHLIMVISAEDSSGTSAPFYSGEDLMKSGLKSR